MSESFQVDLTGVVDLLSRHLYSGPQVYLRELIQNGVDAIAARHALDPSAPDTIRIESGVDEDGVAFVEIRDSGIGLTADEARELLSTIGRSSKRDADFGMARAEFVGQFGIGLLAAFMVAERIDVYSTSARPDAPRVGMHWTGHADGSFEVRDLDVPGESGTTVRLRARGGAAHWFDPLTVAALAADFGSLLPVDLCVKVPVGDGDALWRRVSVSEPPWRTTYESETVRRAALSQWCEQVFGFTPLAYIDLEQPLLGLTGVAFVLPEAVAPGASGHRVYVKRMLVGPRIDNVMPDWAFFARAAIDSGSLTPTASREQLTADATLIATRDALSAQLRDWVLRTMGEPSDLSRAFLQTHHLALRAVARQDPDLLELVARTVPFETSDGTQTLADAAGSSAEILYTTTTEAYRRVEVVARAHGLSVVNAGYVYDSELLVALGRRPGWRTRELVSGDLSQVLDEPSPERQAAFAEALAQARRVLADEDADVIVRAFEPANVPAILLREAEGERQRDRDRERAHRPELWGGLLDSFSPAEALPTRTLVLNDRTPVVRTLLAAADKDTFTAGLRAIYLSAVMMSGEPLRSREVTSLNDALSVLLRASLPDDPHSVPDEWSLP